GYSEAIVDDVAESKEEKNELAEIIHEESMRMGRLVNELLDLARMEAGHLELKREAVDIEMFVDRIINKFYGMANENDIVLTLTKRISVKTVVMDPDRIEQALTNLIDNAIRHTKEKGNVHVIVDTNDDEIANSVVDNGSGIHEEDVAFVCERCNKADKSRKRTTKKKRTGLGLSSDKKLVEAPHGHISVKSKLTQGTTFTSRIPTDAK